MKRLFFKDQIDPFHNKNDGFVNNPTGSWTFHDWWEKIKDDPAEVAKQVEYMHLDLNDDLTKRAWNKIKIILELNPISENSKLRTELNKIWSLAGTDKTQDIYSENQEVKFIAILEKIVALASPIIPLLDVDNAWSVSRIYGIDNTYQYALQYAYDVLNKPDPSLPGKDVMINERS